MAEEIREHAESVQDELSAHVEIPVDEIADRLTTLVDEYKVPVDEARRSVQRHYLDEAGVEGEVVQSGGGSQDVNLGDIDRAEEWVDVTVKLVDLWDPRSESVAQVGLVGDATGTLKFTKWAKSDLPTLEEGASYRLSNVVTDEYQGDFSIKLNSSTDIEQIDEEIEVGDDSAEIEGALVDIQSGSGLIKRCPEPDCTRVLQNGRCAEHGEVEGEFDMRIKGVIDDGQVVQEVIFDKEATASVADITLEEAKDMAMDALDTTIVADEIRERTLGRYYRIRGPEMGRYVLADEVSSLDAPADAESVLIRARSI